MNDLKQDGISNVFSGESRRLIKENGNIELNELGGTTREIQYPSCWTFSQKRNSLLLTWNMSNAFARANRKDQESN